MDTNASIDLQRAFQALSQLRGAWADTRASKGGLVALAGFEFQLSKGLLEAIRQASAGKPPVLIEALSDIVTADRGITIVQAKRTLSSSAFHSALAELWEIEQLARQRTPELRPKLRYEVQSARRVLADWQGSRDRWLPAPPYDPLQLAEFKSRVGAGVTSSPRLEAARLLLSHFKDPQPIERLDRALGRLLTASSTGSLDTVLDELEIELRALQHSQHSQELRFGLWGTGDQSPSDVDLELDERKAVRIGERLSVVDLREGRLAGRAIYGKIHTAAERWLQEADQEATKVPLFWIEGRSGAGKSAALLHNLAKLHAENPDRAILWLGDRVDLTSEALRWAEPLIRDGRTVIVGLDDPCTAERVHDFERVIRQMRGDWETLLSGSRDIFRPAIVSPRVICCGPVEQRHTAEDACGSDIEVTPYCLPHETQADLDELARWYRLRTGKEVQPLQGDVLLVQRFFEWTKGSIGDFASRFRRRLEAFDSASNEKRVFDVVAKILALGRLYVDYPLRVLNAERGENPHLDAALIQLADEEAHFSFGLDERVGVRLTHPHLADAIYREWFGRPKDRPFRLGHLKEALKAAVENTADLPAIRLAPLWAVSRLAQETDHRGRNVDAELRERLDMIRPEILEVLRDIYSAEAKTTAPLEDLPVWVGLDADLQLTITPDPRSIIAKAIAAASGPARGLRLSSHKLLFHAPSEDEKEIIGQLLTRAVLWREHGKLWPDWIHLAVDFMRRVGLEPILGAVETLVKTDPEWPLIGQLMLEVTRHTSCPEAAPLILSWLHRTGSHVGGWIPVLHNLHDKFGRSDQFDAVALRFLGARLDHGDWGFIWMRLFDDNVVARDSLIARAMSWLGVEDGASRLQTDRESASFDRVWQRVWDYYEGDQEKRDGICRAGMRWLAAVGAANSGWSYVWVNLWKEKHTGPEKQQLLDLAVRWLRLTLPDHLGWGYVWEDAMREPDASALDALLDIAAEWLIIVEPEHPSWTYVWAATLDHIRDPGELRRRIVLAYRWLEASSLSRSWSFVWKTIADTLLESTASQLEDLKPAALDYAIAWLRRKDVYAPTSPTICGRAITLTEPDSAAEKVLYEAGCAILRETANPGWQFLWVSLIGRFGPRSDLIALADRWLGANHKTTQWHYIRKKALSLSKALPKCSETETATLDRFGGEDQNAAWLELWNRLPDPLERLKEPAFWDRAQQVVDTGLTETRWPSLFAAMTDAPETDSRRIEALRTAGAEWLRTSPDLHHAWPFVWRKAMKLKGVKQGVKLAIWDIGIAWLGRATDHPRWAEVWARIRFESPETVAQEDIQRAAFDWLVRPLDKLQPWYEVAAWRLKLTIGGAEVTRVFDRGIEWLSLAKEGHRGWSVIWKMLLDLGGQEFRGRLLTIGEEWLGANPDHPAWGFVWQEAWKRGGPDSRRKLSALGQNWLDAAVGDPQRIGAISLILRRRQK